MRHRILVIAAMLAAALTLGAAAATAATIDDLRKLGYTVNQSNPGPADGTCPIYYVSGHGVGIYVNCQSQGAIDSLANPVVICNADWQINHPDQLQAFQSIASKGWSLSGDQCADRYTVTNPNTATAAYSGAGAGLPGFDKANGSPPAAPAPAAGAPPAAPPPGPTYCLPLCPAVGDTRGGGGILIPATPTRPAGVLVPATATAPAQPLTASSAVPPITDPAVAPTAAAILYPDASAGYLLRAGIGTDGALAPTG